MQNLLSNAYKTSNNSVYFTEEVIKCSKSNKQIYRGFVVKVNTDINIYSEEFFHSNTDRIINTNESIELGFIVSNASPLKITMKKERSKMTVKLRYTVLKRDSFKCKYCGKTAEESKLHVDHIKPVSKGGISNLDNLHTLCQDCNLGKSNL